MKNKNKKKCQPRVRLRNKSRKKETKKKKFRVGIVQFGILSLHNFKKLLNLIQILSVQKLFVQLVFYLSFPR